ncbi:sigma-54-dependent transcriptional regulator [Desulfovibrio inopinatus]|uniref:sigma-54-dependent transcriptional regulator n=1 Tax=Desulfovibrio inopinatus TaxID=102109 RepID=UPI0003F50424|nr:sigma-54 dependent transcriptional regulator [Desulfovibrio inopinatus]
MSEKILVIEDEPAFRAMLCEALTDKGYAPVGVGSAEEGVERVKQELFDLILTDVMLPGMSGMEGISQIKEADPSADIIVMTGYATKESALEAIGRGAYDYFTKPFNLVELEIVIRRALERRRLRNELAALKNTLAGGGRIPAIIGQSEPMRRLKEMIHRVAVLDTTVLVTGESGTGKELISDAIHSLSPRSAEPFIKVNCAAIPENLLESELFGHEKGAFTGAHQRKKGKFELADKGTILLDEIGDMPLFLQPKLLRAVEQKQIEKLGGIRPVDFDARIIAATNQNLPQLIEEKKFRDDLYYRLSVATLKIPPLRERKEDLPLLVSHFLERINAKIGTNFRGVSKDGMGKLFEYDWPGNVRQLANLLERAAILSSGEILSLQDVNEAFDGPVRPSTVPATTPPAVMPEAHALGVPDPALPADTGQTVSLRETLEQVERNLIISALKRAGGVQKDAAGLLGVSSKNLWNKIQKHGIDAQAYTTAGRSSAVG